MAEIKSETIFQEAGRKHGKVGAELVEIYEVRLCLPQSNSPRKELGTIPSLIAGNEESKRQKCVGQRLPLRHVPQRSS